MDREFVESLGWKYLHNWANRDFYGIGKYTILEHNGDWCISTSDDLYFADIKTEDMLKEYTNLINKKIEIEKAPSNHSLQEYWDINNKIDNFYAKCKEQEEEDEEANLHFSDLIDFFAEED